MSEEKKKWSKERIGFMITVFLFICSIGGWIIDREVFRAQQNNKIENVCAENKGLKIKVAELEKFKEDQLLLNGGYIVVMKLITNSDD